jgi:hypothetical protein
VFRAEVARIRRFDCVPLMTPVSSDSVGLSGSIFNLVPWNDRAVSGESAGKGNARSIFRQLIQDVCDE